VGGNRMEVSLISEIFYEYSHLVTEKKTGAKRLPYLLA
jgi:hypothetical protein